jgi:Fe-S cluster assembly protein SufB
MSCNKKCVSKTCEYAVKKGLDEKTVREISAAKNEPEWMLEYRLKALQYFLQKRTQAWGPSLEGLDLDNIHYYVRPKDQGRQSWDDVSEDVRETFEDLGVLKDEALHFGGMGAQYESEMVYHNLKKEWADQGVLFFDTDTALREHPELFKQYFGTVVPFSDNKFSALNSAVWSGGSFIYVPPGVKLTMPLQTYFRMQSEALGQFERTLIIADEGSFVHYIEGCTASSYTESSLHAAVVEVIALKGSRVRYSTIQNWSKNVYNLVTKRAVAYEDSILEWIDGNLGSGVTMKYPCVVLKEKGARAEMVSVAMASSPNQVQDSGAKAIHCAPNTSSKIISKSISKNGGRASYRGVVKVLRGATGCKSFVQCDSLLLDELSQADAYPYIDVAESEVDIGHEARVSSVGDEQLFYLMSRGINKDDAQALVVNGFIDPFVKELPMEYAIEMNRLVELEMEGDGHEK